MSAKHFLSALSALSSFAMAAAGCSGEQAQGAEPLADAGTRDDGGMLTGDAAVEPTCPPLTGEGTMHHGDVVGDEVWTAAGSPHVIAEDVNVRDGATLTIEPCAEVHIAEDRYLHVAYPLTPNTGTLIAEGTATEPIRFRGLDGARWGNVYVHAPGTARFAHVTFEDGGSGAFQHNATLYATGDGVPPGDPILYVDHVTIDGSLGTGVWMRSGASFAPGSTELIIRGSGSDDFPYPIEIEEPTIDTLPSGNYTGNRVDEILLEPTGNGVAGGGLVEDATMRDLGVPYHIGNDSIGDFVIGGGDEGTLATLTIEAGVVLKFEPETALDIQHFTTDEPSTGALRALGTADRPVVFTSASKSPRAGDWRGLWFGGIPSDENRIEHARIEYAGFDCSCSLVTCSGISEYEAAVIFTAQPPSAFITNTVFSHVAGHGVTQGFDGTLVNFRPTNTFEDVSGCVQTRPRDIDTSCPDPLPACD